MIVELLCEICFLSSFRLKPAFMTNKFLKVCRHVHDMLIASCRNYLQQIELEMDIGLGYLNVVDWLVMTRRLIFMGFCFQ